MNKSNSKYFYTSQLMNQALIELLYKKDYDYITVKEICEKAGVNRSTFYLHYETINDLLEECLENIIKKFNSCFNNNNSLESINELPLEKLIFLTPEYLTPYLQFIKDNRKIYQIAVKKAKVMNSVNYFNSLSTYILKPVLRRFNVDESVQEYMISYYIGGINAIVCEWIKHDCKKEISDISNIIIDCVRPYFGKLNYEKNNTDY